MKTSTKSITSYSFGDIAVSVEVEGNVDRPQQVIDHMLSAANTTTSIEVVNHGISESMSSDDRTKQKCTAKVTFGEITVITVIEFDLNRKVSKRVLNSIVFGAVLPKVWKTAELYFGDNQSLTNPPAPATPRSRQEILAGIDDTLSLNAHPQQQHHENGLAKRQPQLAH